MFESLIFGGGELAFIMRRVVFFGFGTLHLALGESFGGDVLFFI